MEKWSRCRTFRPDVFIGFNVKIQMEMVILRCVCRVDNYRIFLAITMPTAPTLLRFYLKNGHIFIVIFFSVGFRCHPYTGSVSPEVDNHCRTINIHRRIGSEVRTPVPGLQTSRTFMGREGSCILCLSSPSPHRFTVCEYLTITVKVS